MSECSLTYAVPVPPRAEPLPPGERRAAILTATRPLLLQHGPALTTRQIADAAGVAEGTLFRVFADKGEIIQALIEDAMDPTPICEELAGIDPTLELEDRLRLVILIVQRRIVEVSGLFAALMSRGHQGKPQARPSAEVERARADQLRDAVVAVIGDDAAQLSLPVDRAAAHIRSVAFATSHPLLSDGSLTDAREIVAVILHGLLKEDRC